MDQIKRILFFMIRMVYYTLAAYGLLLVFMWWQDDTSPVIFGSASVSTPAVRPGDTVIFTQEITKNRMCLGEVNRWIEGECGYKSISENNAVLPIGVHQLVIPVTLPVNFIPGECKFMSRNHYICNPMDFLFNRKIYYSTPIRFKVIP